MSKTNYLEKPEKLYEKLIALRKEVVEEGNKLYDKWQPYLKQDKQELSARNLAYYLVLRNHDIRKIQEALTPWGLSSLGRLESRVLDNLDAVILSLGKVLEKDTDSLALSYPSVELYISGNEELEKNTATIFGEKPVERFTRIMVTLPSETAKDNSLVEKLMKAGMNVGRINCAHDDPETWSAMVKTIRKCEKKLGQDCQILMDIAGPKARVSWIFTTLKKPKVKVGHEFVLTGADTPPKVNGMDLMLGCSVPEVLDDLKEGDPIKIDDGIVEGIVKEVIDEGVVIKIKKVDSKKGVRLKAEKGLNFPESELKMDFITDKDKQDLDFVCKHADIIGFSFVKNAEDVQIIQKELQKRMSEKKAQSIPLMAKIETVEGVRKLPEIIVAAAGQNPFSVMIARGDLAVEAGFLRLAELQQEILWICEAADVPVVWGTQVLENMVSNGIPTRAEVTDAAQGSRSECVMLNKGEYLIESVDFLADIIKQMHEHEYKKTPKLRALNIAKREIEKK
ncbi:pyruvate kinase [Desemzia sp. RIT804]|uniref:pyruvate kinase n=1 Tax=Desemzia sp. RIT 804 TaxID=2810209 RepID=UPI0019505AFE|nr:pyruvate kinase [Desemzia sp. RIT 804]